MERERERERQGEENERRGKGGKWAELVTKEMNEVPVCEIPRGQIHNCI